jgi:hypothetical protein
MTLTNNTNRPRKNLADQIDRLDSILDGLADNLNEAVATAVQQAVAAAVQEAVKQAVIEVVTNAELQQLLRPPAPRAEAQTERQLGSTDGGGFLGGLWQAVRGVAGRVAETAGRAASAVGGWMASTARQARDLVASGVQKVRRGARTLYAWVLTSRVTQVLGVGGLIAAVCFVVNPALAGAVGAAALAVAAAVSQLPAHLMDLLGRTALSS